MAYLGYKNTAFRKYKEQQEKVRMWKKAEAKKRNIDLLGEIPISVDVRKSSDAGIPIIISEPKSIQSQNYRLIAKSIIKSIKLDEEELS